MSASTATARDGGLRVTAGRNVIFAAPPDVPRARRPVDVAILAGTVLVGFLLGWYHRAGGDLDVRVLEFVDGGLPGWISGVATIVFLLGGLYSGVLIAGIALFGNGRAAVARDMILAAALSFGFAVVGSYAAGPEFPDLLPEFRDIGFPSFPVIRLAMAVAAIRVAGPYLSVPMRKVGHRLIVVMAISALVMSYGTLSAVIGGLALGSAAAAAVHLVFGSGLGIPSRARIVAALSEAQLDVVDVVFIPVQPVGASLVRARLADGDDVLVKVYGRDASDAAFAARFWRALWYRDSTASIWASSEQLAEHESLMMLACERAGLATPRLVAWSRASTDDTIIVGEWVDGVRLSEIDPSDLDDDTLDDVWAALRTFAEAGMVHRAIDLDQIIVTGDGVLLTDLGAAHILGDDDERAADAAQILVATAIVVGEERAIDAARRNLGDDAIAGMLPLLQPAALPRALQREARAAGLKASNLRKRVAELLDVPQPEVVQLQRVTWGNVIIVLLTLFAASSLISALTDIGLDTIADQIDDAVWAWVVVALILAQLTNVGEYFSLVGVVGFQVPFGPTMMFRYALSFISLAVPSEAGAIAMNVRYQQKLGVAPAAAIAQGPLLTIFSKGFDLILLLLSARFIGEAIDTDQIELGPIVRLVAVVIIVAIVAIVVVAAVPKLRAKAVPHIREGFSAVKGSVTDPERLLKIAGGTLLQKILFALALSAAVSAYGGSLRFGEALFVNTAVSLLVGLVPVPGGIGVAETALTAALIAVGVPEEAALAAALTHRMLTAYLPPVFGWWAARWLTARDYL